MEIYTLKEAIVKLKEHKITADSRKLIREAIAEKISLSMMVHGAFYSPTIKSKCRSVVSKYNLDLLGAEKSKLYDDDEVTNEFESELVRELFNFKDWQSLNNNEKISYLNSSSHNGLINEMYDRYSNQSLTGYCSITPSQLINQQNGVYKIKGFKYCKNDYFSNLKVGIDDLLIDEYNLNQYIKSLSEIPPKPKRINRLYTEIMNILPNWRTMNAYEILDKLKPFAGKDGSCIVSVSSNSVTWFNEANLESATKLMSLQKWITRQKQT
jgi:hypothetical protein